MMIPKNWMLALLIGFGFSTQAQSKLQLLVSEDQIKEHVYYLASDELEGRGTNSKGYELASAYSAEKFQAFGLSTLLSDKGEKTFFQNFELKEVASRGSFGRFRLVDKGYNAVSRNVVGVVEGSDAKLKNEFIVITAHLDHLGIVDNKIYNGANDNATGSAAVLELARTIALKPLKRSVMFVLFGAEEVGLLGSAYFVDNSPIPMNQIVANLNLDGVGAYINQPGEQIKELALGADITCPELLDRLIKVNGNTEKIELETRDPQGYFKRSDQYNFHLKGVPIIMFTDYGNGHYHLTTDDAPILQFSKLARFVNMVNYLAIDLGNGAPLCAEE